MSLSEKIIEDGEWFKHGWLQIEDVREFIKDLKGKLDKWKETKKNEKLPFTDSAVKEWKRFINQLAGDDLI